ncbi:MAG TPA: TolC family protein [Cyclobacteriaceae bacterium]|nr:TolC family protein [Cyclobacteriaceae bacterium]
MKNILFSQKQVVSSKESGLHSDIRRSSKSGPLTNYYWLLTTILVGFATSTAYSQEPLSLAQAIAVGMKNNFDVQIEQQNIDVAVNNNTWGQAGMLPTISLISNSTNNIVQRKPANPFAVAGLNKSSSIPGQLDVQFVLFDGFLIRYNKQRLEELERLSYGNATFVMETAVQSIILGYYQALLEKERLKVFEVTQTLSKERYNYVKLRKQLGGAITFDVLQEQNNYLTDSANVLRQQITYKNTLRGLNLLLSEEITKQFTLVDSLVHETELYSYEDLRTKMTSSNTNLQNQFINQELLRNNTQIMQSNYSPSVILNMGATGSLDQLNAKFRPTENGTVTKSTVGYLNDDPNQPVIASSFLPEYKTQSGYSYGVYGNLSLRFTIFQGGQIRRSIENARIQEKIGVLGTSQLKLSLENDLLVNYDNYNLRQQLVTISQTKLQAAELNLNLANERYKNGALSAIDLRIVQENFRNAAVETFVAIYSSIESRVALIRLTGGLIDKKQIRP